MGRRPTVESGERDSHPTESTGDGEDGGVVAPPLDRLVSELQSLVTKSTQALANTSGPRRPSGVVDIERLLARGEGDDGDFKTGRYLPVAARPRYVPRPSEELPRVGSDRRVERLSEKHLVDAIASQTTLPAGGGSIDDPESARPTHTYLPAVKVQQQLDRVESVRRSQQRPKQIVVGLLLLSAFGAAAYHGARSLIDLRPKKRRAQEPIATTAIAPVPTLARADDAGTYSAGSVDSAPEHAGKPGVRVGFQRLGSRILVPVTLSGPRGALSARMVLDTGATFTTLDSRTLASLGVQVDGRAPAVSVRTASGAASRRLVVIERVSVGRATVSGGLTVSVCEACATEQTVGLLGLNFSRHFRVSIDQDRGQLSLRPRGRAVPRLFDIRPFVDLSDAESRRRGPTLSIWVTLHNRSSRKLRRLGLVAVDAAGPGRLATEVLDVGPWQKRRVKLVGRAPPARRAYQVKLETAEW